ncbi:MAG: hypothetical protein JXR07_15020 [Reichenbachiella sp.]
MRIFEFIREAMTASITMRATIILYLIVYVSVSHLPQYLDCMEVSSIELTEEKEMDTEEKESEEEVKKAVFANRSLSYEILLKSKFSSKQYIYWFWKATDLDIPTPPPKV